MDAPINSKIFLNTRGWIEVIWNELIDSSEYVAVAKEMLRLVTLIEDKGQKPLMLIDFSQLTKITPDAASLASKATRDLGCKKIAGFGIKPEFKSILDTIKINSTKANSIREFSSRSEAEAWLNQT